MYISASKEKKNISHTQIFINNNSLIKHRQTSQKPTKYI